MTGAVATHAAEQIPRRPPSVLRALARDGRGLAGGITIGFLLLVALVGHWLPLRPFTPDLDHILDAPSLRHPFGTDFLGRDVFSRVVWGAQSSLLIGFGSVLVSLVIGIVVGNAAGYAGGATDGLLMWIVNVGLSVPPMLIAISVVAVAGPGVLQLIVAITLAYSPKVIRLQRSLTLSWKSRSFIEAARLAGVPTHVIVLRHVVPNSLAPMVVAGTVQVGNAVIVAASLSFLGLGITPPDPSWGNIVAEGVPYLQDGWWVSTLPALVIVVVTSGLHLVGDACRRILDPANEAGLL